MNLFGTFFMLTALMANPEKKDDYLKPNLPIEQRVESLLSQMTIEEKIAQMDMLAIWDEETLMKTDITRGAGVGAWIGETTPEKYNQIQRYSEGSRLKIPYLIGVDAAHGHAIMPGRTVYPTSIGMAATFNPTLLGLAASQSAAEIRASGNNWTFAPCVDIVQDARWGRTGETYGECPYLSSELVKAAVKGLQGNLDPSRNVAATVKHFVGGGASVGGVNHGNAELSERMLRNVFFPPFKAAIDAGVLTIMPGHNDVNGIPVHASKPLLTDLIKKEYQFNGFFISDMGDVENLLPDRIHHIAKDQKDAVRLSVNAGLDMHMFSWNKEMFMDKLKELYDEGAVEAERIDDAVRRILRVKFALGLFENRYIDVEANRTNYGSKEAKETALEAARQSIVLLKNSNGLLPLDAKKYKRILVTGSNADNQSLLGDWSNPQPDENVTTVLEGLRQELNAQITYVESGKIKGKRSDVKIETTDPVTQAKFIEEGGEISDFTIRHAVEEAKKNDLAIVVIGGQGLRSDWGMRTYGESADRPSIDFYGRQVELVQALMAAQIPVVVVMINGKPLNNPWITTHVPAIIEAWEPGMAGGQAIGEIIAGKVNPSGKLPITIPQHAGQVPMYYYQTKSRVTTGYRLGGVPEDDKPAFCFGHGLSYTTFSCKEQNAQDSIVVDGKPMQITLEVKNTGKVDGSQTLMAFVRDDVSSVVTPMTKLSAFQKVFLSAGQSKRVTLEVPFDAFKLWNGEMKHVIESGTFTIMVGSSVDDIYFSRRVRYN